MATLPQVIFLPYLLTYLLNLAEQATPHFHSPSASNLSILLWQVNKIIYNHYHS